VSQIIARASAFGDQARIYAECTMSTEAGRVYEEVAVYGTDTRLHLPCVYCGRYQYPARDRFVGWQEAADINEARARARYECEHCGLTWDEEDRLSAMEDALPVARGQSVDAHGRITGDPPNTTKLGFRWHWMHSPMRSMALIGEREWLAEQRGSTEAKRGIYQFEWAEPYDELIREDAIHLDRQMILGKQDPMCLRGSPPDDATLVTAGIDVGMYRLHWVVAAFAPDPERGWVIDFGVDEVPQGARPDAENVAAVLRDLREQLDGIGIDVGGFDNYFRNRFCLIRFNINFHLNMLDQMIFIEAVEIAPPPPNRVYSKSRYPVLNQRFLNFL